MEDNKRKGQLVVTGEGDVPAFIISDAEVPRKHFNGILTPVFPCQMPFIRLQKTDFIEGSNFKNLKSQHLKPLMESNNKIETIWAKPSGNLQGKTILKDGKRRYSSEKTCCYTGSSNETSTHSSSQTQGSSGESDTEEDASYSNESEGYRKISNPSPKRKVLLNKEKTISRIGQKKNKSTNIRNH